MKSIVLFLVVILAISCHSSHKKEESIRERMIRDEIEINGFVVIESTSFGSDALHPDTIIEGDLRKAVIYMMKDRNMLLDQINAGDKLLQTLNCSSPKNDSMYREYLSARLKWWKIRGWDIKELKDTCCCKQ